MENSFVPFLSSILVLHPAIQPSTSLYSEYIPVIQEINNTIVHRTHKFLTINLLFLTINLLFLARKSLFLTINLLFLARKSLFLTINLLFLARKSLFLTINLLFLARKSLFLTIKLLFLTINWHSSFFKMGKTSYPRSLIMQTSPFIYIAAEVLTITKTLCYGYNKSNFRFFTQQIL